MKEVYDVFWRGQKAKFVVSNPEDLVQSCFVQRHFFSIEELEDLLFYVKPNSVILDIGANVGNHTVFFAKHFQAKNVVPFEVNPTAVELLRLNVELNHLTNVDLSQVGVGVGAQRGTLYLTKSIENNLAATSFSTSISSRSKEISFKVDTLDNLLSSDTQVDFVKIDVEGMEFDVLDGGRKFIQKCRPVVFLECWGWVASLKLLCWIVENNYRIEKKYGPSYLAVPLAPKEHYTKDYSRELNWIALRSITENGEVLASEGITKLQERFKTNPHVSYAFVEILLKLNQMDAAQKAIRDVEDASKHGVVAWYQAIAELSERCGDDSSKLEALSKAALLSPNDIQIVEQLSNAYLASGDEEAASNLITHFLEQNPESAKGHYIKSTLAELEGQLAKALEHAGLSVKLDSPDKPSFMVRLADLTRRCGESPAAALDIVNEAIRLGQTSDWAYQVKVVILESLDKRFSAKLFSVYRKTRTVLRQAITKLKLLNTYHKTRTILRRVINLR